MKLYAASLIAQRPDGIYHAPIAFWSESRRAAERKARETAFQLYPPGDGYVGHGVAVGQVTDEQGRFLGKAAAGEQS